MSSSPERASLEGIETEVFKLVSHGATQEQWAEWLRTPLEHAAAQGNLGLVNKLIEAGADGSAGWKGCNGRTLLHAAASGGDDGVISSLLRQGSQPDVNVLPSPGGISALYEATVCGHEAAARLLILAGADVDFSDPEDGQTLLHAAICCGHERLAKELVMSGANVNARGVHDGTPLHDAAREGLEGVVSALLLRGADKDAVDDKGYTALMEAAKNGFPTVVESLLAAGVDVDLRCTDPDGRAHSALDMAALEGNVTTLQALVKGGADTKDCDEFGATALHFVASSSRASSIDALIEAGANVEARCNLGETPLHWAASYGNRRALHALLRNGANPNVGNDEEMTPLHAACLEQPEDLLSVVDLLLRWDADETALDDKYENPSDLLDTVRENGDCSEDMIGRVRALLARAPADRDWRLRGWLVMLRARAWKARNTGGNQHGHGDDDIGRSVARCEGVGDVRDKASNRSGAGGDVESVDLVRAVALLTELQPECVFRLIVGFLG